MRIRRSASILVILSTLILSSICFAAPPDRISGPLTAASTVSLGSGLQTHFWAKYDQGPIEPTFQLNSLAFVIAPSARQQKALDKLLAQQQDPQSPQYHKWLTPEQYGDRFGLSPNDLKKITDWLQSQGFTHVNVVRSSNIVKFSGTAAQVEATFRTQIHRYEVEGKFQFSNVTPPQIPAALSGIVMGMRGLNNYHMKSMLKRRKANYNDSSFFAGQVLAPADIATIYDIPSSMDGSGQTIAIIGRSDIYEDDLSDFRTGFGLPAISGCTSDPTSGVITACNTTYFQYVLVLNGTETDPLAPDSIVTGDLVEADLDLEWSGSTAPKAQIIYVNAPATTGNDVVDAMSYAITNNVAPVVSMSFGLCELGTAVNATFGIVQFTETEFQQANTQGMTIINSSGDGGAAECDYGLGNSTAVNGYTVNYPASSPEVTGVGGTLIPLISPNEYTTASTCSSSVYWNTTGTTGGSACSYIPEQAWNEDEEFGLYCSANPTDSFCTHYGVTDWATAQAAFGIGGGGGGISNCATINTTTGECLTGYPQPSYQSGLSVTLPSPAPETTTPARYVPDVSLLASPDFPGYIFCTAQTELGGTSSSSSCSTSIADSLAAWGTVAGGTSFATPVFAGMVALLNQSLSSPGLGNINPTLYALAATQSNGAFNPVITPSSGAYSNGAFCTAGSPGAPQPSQLWCPAGGFLGFNAYDSDSKTNYNLVTGLGSVDVGNFVLAYSAAIADFSITSTGSSSLTVSAGETTPATYQFTLAPIGTASTFGEDVTFACSFSPTDPTLTNGSCTFNPTFISASTLATQGTVTMSITTVGPNKSSSSAEPRQRADNHPPRSPWLPLSIPIAGVLIAGFAGRKLSRYSMLASLGLALVMAGLLVACGGSSAPPISVTNVTSSPSAVYANDTADGWPSQTTSLSATVANDSQNKGVTWTAALGTIVSTGLTTATYTAPTIASGLPASDTITATSVTDTTKSAQGAVTLTRATVPNTYTVTITATKGSHVHTKTVALVVQ